MVDNSSFLDEFSILVSSKTDLPVDIKHRLMCIAQNTEFVLHFCPTLTQLFQLESLFRICNMTCLHGPSAFFLIAELLSTTLLG